MHGVTRSGQRLADDARSPAPPPDQPARCAASPSPAATSAPGQPRTAGTRPRISPAAAATAPSTRRTTVRSSRRRAQQAASVARIEWGDVSHRAGQDGPARRARFPDDPAQARRPVARPGRKHAGSAAFRSLLHRQRVFHASSTAPVPGKTEARWAKGGKRNSAPDLKRAMFSPDGIRHSSQPPPRLPSRRRAMSPLGEPGRVRGPGATTSRQSCARFSPCAAGGWARDATAELKMGDDLNLETGRDRSGPWQATVEFRLGTPHYPVPA